MTIETRTSVNRNCDRKTSIVAGKALTSRAGIGTGGFTLTEVVASCALMGIFFITLFTALSGGFAITQLARENLRSTQILVERMEGIRLFNWNQIGNTNLLPRAFTNYFYPLAGSGESKGIAYTGTVVIATPNFDPAVTYTNDMKSIKVTVKWMSGKVLRTRTMTTYVSRNGIQNYVYAN